MNRNVGDGGDDVFRGADGNARVLLGVAVYSNSTRLAEMAARIGFDSVWIEMEHGTAGFDDVEALCTAVEAGGGMPTVRVPDGQRHHVLRALETGARIVVVPMVNTADEAKRIVEYGKFPPVGARGYNTRSRGVGYGLGDRKAAFTTANARTHLFAQIETMESVANVEELCRVDGLSGIFIGPGDLSVSIGCAGELNDERVIEVAVRCIKTARATGKHAGILVGPGKLLEAAFEAGCDLAFCGGDVTELASGWPRLLQACRASRGGTK